MADKWNKVYIMGGTIYAWGNITFGAEFNFQTDPEAAFIVFKHLPYIHLLPWETAKDNKIDKETREELESDGDKYPLAELYKHMNKKYMRPDGGVTSCDGLALACAIKSDIITSTEEAFGQIETQGTRSAGGIFWNHNILLEEGRDDEGQLKANT